ncbi:MAG: Type 1 glutamine amidotransferase-like domain-containing protein [Bacteroidota bacterium]
MKYLSLVFLCISSLFTSVELHGQAFRSWFTGSRNDLQATPQGGVCLMGGASENDEAMKWFLERSGGGDILVLRASGSDGYNDYLFSQLGVSVNSVETLLFNQVEAIESEYIHERIKQAEAIWFAGGDQYDYINFWRGTAIDSLINEGISERNIVIGGTSAGMAILGGNYFTAENGTVRSEAALFNPFRQEVQINNEPFLNTPFLENVITDTHYDNPDRKGRHMVFMARALSEGNTAIKGIACEEYTAVCIDENGIARVFGDFPNEEDVAYFLQLNCDLVDPRPEQLSPGQVLDWDKEGKALRVFEAKGTPNGSVQIDLTDWESTVGGEWKFWSVKEGQPTFADGDAPNCALSTALSDLAKHGIRVYSAYPKLGEVIIESSTPVSAVSLWNLNGQKVYSQEVNTRRLSLSTKNFPPGIYLLEVHTPKGKFIQKQLAVSTAQ